MKLSDFHAGLIAALCAVVLAPAGRCVAGDRLYARPAPEAAGGIAGRIDQPRHGLVGVFAVPPDDPLQVYQAVVAAGARQEFKLAGLPPRAYDLVLVFDDVFYEGLTLNREDDTLVENDRLLIRRILDASEPFFKDKTIHRLSGRTGDGENACGICTFARGNKPIVGAGGKLETDRLQAIKLVLLQDVGPGWQVVRTREIVTLVDQPGGPPIRHVYLERLHGIRVVDRLKDLGVINLAPPGDAPKRI